MDQRQREGLVKRGKEVDVMRIEQAGQLFRGDASGKGDLAGQATFGGLVAQALQIGPVGRIADEVQPGFGRTGFNLWGFARHGVTPDIVTMGKPMGNGFPMSGVVTRPDLLQKFCEETGYFNTFGGNPVAAAAGLAVLDVIADEGLTENARDVGSYFADSLRNLKSRHVTIGAVRGAGLFIGLDFIGLEDGEPDTALTTHVINEMKKNGILIGAAGKYGATLKIRPPLCFSRADADHFTGVLSGILGNR